MRSFLHPLIAAAICVGVAGVASPALAQSDGDRATARSLGVDGQQALDRKDYKTAEDHFRRADSLVHAPTLMLGLARSLTGLGRYVEAQETYNRIVREGVAPGAPEVFKKALTDAKKEVETVTPKIGGVTITVHAAGGGDVPSAKVLLDGSVVNAASLGVRRSVDPGSHTLQVTAGGFKSAELHFDVTPGASVDEPVALEVDRNAPVATAPETGPATGAENPAVEPAVATSGAGGANGGSHSILPWVAFGIGAAGLGVGAVTGLMAMSEHSTLSGECDAMSVCDTTAHPNVNGDLSTYHTLAAISTVGFIAGGAGVAAGVILLLVQPKGESASPPPPLAPQAGLHVVPTLGLGSIGLAGEF